MAAGHASATSAHRSSSASAGGGGVPTQPPVTAGLQLWFEANTQSGRRRPSGHALDRPERQRPRPDGVRRDGSPTMRRERAQRARGDRVQRHQLAPQDLQQHVHDRAAGHVLHRLQVARRGRRRDTRPTSSTRRTPTSASCSGSGRSGTRRCTPTSTSRRRPPTRSRTTRSGAAPSTAPTLWSTRTGILIASGPAGNSALSGFTVGGLSTGGQYGYLLSHSLVAEILYYSGTMTAPNRQAVTDWLNQKYNVTGPWSPPVEHRRRPRSAGLRATARR